MMRLLSLSFCLLAAWLGAADLRAGTVPIFSETIPFVSGQGGYNTYRIPALVCSTNGTLLAFCEGRKNSASDSGNIDIVLRRSTNNGVTWLPMTVVEDEGGSASITVGNPSPVVDRITGAIHLLFCQNNDLVFDAVSTNDGVSWSARTEITASVKLASWSWYATGPGHGIQLQYGPQAGRLVVACDHTTTNGVNGAHAIYSDDHGASWQLGGVADAAGQISPNETACVELATNGSSGSRVYFNTRNQNDPTGGDRGGIWSNDGGSSFIGSFTNQPAFVCPAVEGSLWHWQITDGSSPSNRILFACPNNASSRTMISLWSSTNEAMSWSAPRLIFPGPSAYSDMTGTSDGEVALLCENGDVSSDETIAFAHFNAAWLDSGATAVENPQPAFWNFEEKPPGQTADTNSGAILDIYPDTLNDNLTAAKAFAYVTGSTNYGSGSALAFDGTGGLQISDAASANHFDFGATNSFTIETVFCIPAGSTQTGALVSKDYGTLLPSWWFRVTDGMLQFLVCDGSSQVAATAVTPLVNDGQWHHAAAVRDTRIPTVKLLRIYLDGVLLTNVVDITTNSLANSQPLDVGCFGNSSTRNLIGDIDLVRITPKALVPSGFVGHWTQFDADGDLIPDSFERTNYNSLETIGPGDTDGDGSSDLVEFVLGTDPLSAASKPQILVTPTPTSVIVTTQERQLPPWLDLELESSTNLSTWQVCNSTNNVVLTPLGNGIFQRQQTVPYPAGTPPTLFFRMQINPLP